MHQVLMNLCINARDAMPNGGTLTLATENISLDAAAAALHPGAKPGNYLCIRVADTGTGISPEQMEKIFQPFFTTKAPGKGTGLGLSTCQSIVKGHGGFIAVTSKENVGTEFKVFLPAANVVSPEQTGISKTSLPAGKGERILVVDDEEGILAITRAALENYGYQVLTVTSGHAAIARFAENPAAINLVLTDLDMPFMDGSATAAALRKIAPDVKIIIASGSEKEIGDARRLAKAHAFIEKPFSIEDLLKTVHEVLAQKK
jgi:CheY-like chemotaxis protein